MKKNIGTIISVVNLILLIICLVWISELKQELQNTRNNMSSQLSNVVNNVNNSYSYIEDKLEEEASIISGAEWNFGEMDVATRTVEVACTVTPKEYQPNLTTAVLVCNGTEVPMTLEAGAYKVTVELPLFEDHRIESVLFYENDTIRTENLDWIISPHYDLVPYVYAYLYGTKHVGKTDDAATWQFSGDVEINVDRKGDPDVERIELVRVLDGKEVERIDIPLSTMDGLNNFYYNWDVEYEIPFEIVQELFVEVELDMGLVYRAQVDVSKIDKTGQPMETGEEYWRNVEATIYDTQGNLLYTVDEELYK